MSIRRLRALIRGIPPDSALQRAFDPNWRWSSTDELLSSLIEVTDRNGRWFAQVHARKGSKVPDPVRIPRPWEREEKSLVSSPEQVRAFFSGGKR